MDEVVVERDKNFLVMKSKEKGDVYSVLVENAFYTNRVWDYFNIGPALADNPKDILVLGLGGGTIVKQFLVLFNSQIDAVEVNPEVVELAAEYFEVRKSDRLKIIVSDALDYLKNTEKKYDVIVVDVFEGDVIPEKFTELSFMELLSKHLSEGVVVVNTITTGKLLATSDLMLQNAIKTFPSVFTLDEEGNRLIIALNFKTDMSFVLGRLDSYSNPLFEELKQKIKSRIR